MVKIIFRHINLFKRATVSCSQINFFQQRPIIVKYAEYVTLQIFKFELVMNLLIVKKKKITIWQSKKIFHTNANRDTMRIAARHESLPCCIQLGNAEAAHSARFLAQFFRSSEASPCNQGHKLSLLIYVSCLLLHPQREQSENCALRAWEQSQSAVTRNNS